MIREIKERFQGRKKTLDGAVDFAEIKTILKLLPETTKINGERWYYCEEYGRFQKIKDFTPQDTIWHIRRYFGDCTLDKFKGNHQVFTGKTDEKHYFDLRQGPFFYRFADARLVYVVEKQGC